MSSQTSANYPHTRTRSNSSTRYASVYVAAGIALLISIATTSTSAAVELHVALAGADTNPGTPHKPLRTIQRAADLAQLGDTVTVHAGVYREYVNPPRGGKSDSMRITYQAAPGEKVEIKGAEVVKGWVKVQNDTWKATLPNALFGSFNPYQDVIWGDWFHQRGGRTLHTGAVYLNGEWLTEAVDATAILRPVADTPSWFARVDETNTTLWAQFPNADPNTAVPGKATQLR